MESAKFKKGWAWILVLAALATLALKFSAWGLSHSVGLFSDAAESLVNLTAALMALFALNLAEKPADREHSYGHEKIEFFSSGIEGALIIVAAFWLMGEAVWRFLHPQELKNVFFSLQLAVVAAIINGVVARLLLKASQIHDSIVLGAAAKHLMADVWTTLGVLAGLGLFVWTGKLWLDPLVAVFVGLQVIYSGVTLVRRSVHGLMDRALPENEILEIRKCIAKHLGPYGRFHAFRTRKSGPRRFVDFHLLIPGNRTLHEAHEITLAMERELETALPHIDVTIHMEPIEDPQSWEENSVSRRVE